MQKLLTAVLLAVTVTLACESGELDLKDPSRIYVGVGASNFNTYVPGDFSIENDQSNLHSQGLSLLTGYELFENYDDTFTIDGELRVGQSYWNYPLNVFSADLLAKATYFFGYVGVYALGGASYLEFSNKEVIAPTFGVGAKGLVTDHTSVYVDYLGKTTNTWNEELMDSVDIGVVTVGVSYKFQPPTNIYKKVKWLLINLKETHESI